MQFTGIPTDSAESSNSVVSCYGCKEPLFSSNGNVLCGFTRSVTDGHYRCTACHSGKCYSYSKGDLKRKLGELVSAVDSFQLTALTILKKDDDGEEEEHTEVEEDEQVPKVEPRKFKKKREQPKAEEKDLREDLGRSAEADSFGKYLDLMLQPNAMTRRDIGIFVNAYENHMSLLQLNGSKYNYFNELFKANQDRHNKKPTDDNKKFKAAIDDMAASSHRGLFAGLG